MRNIKLIIKKEYLTRVKSKSFLLITFLSPVLFALLIFAPIWLGQIKSNKTQLVGVMDQSGQYVNRLQSNNSYLFVPVTGDNLKKVFANQDNQYAALLYIKTDLTNDSLAATLYSSKQVGVDTKMYISNQLEQLAQQDKIHSYGIDNLEKIINESKVKINLGTIKLEEDGSETRGSAELALIIAMVITMMIYMFILLYGQQVMNVVMEEKTNRIVEILVSSVKPFDLMMGKIIGVALVGLTQFILWGVFTALIVVAISLFSSIGGLGNTADMQAVMTQMNTGVAPNSLSMEAFSALGNFFGTINVAELLFFFLFYFIGGYLLYASLFAAVGAAVDSPNDANQFMTPLMLPMIFAIYAGIFGAQNPDGPLAFWGSIIPFTSPIVMMARLPFGVPLWQKLLSMTLLILSFWGSTWVSAKIYRTGILMYGKKFTYKEIWKWLKYKS